MPSNLLNADVGFPQLNEEQSNDEKINKIVDYLYMLLEQLRYSFGNMDKDNFSESGLDELEHLITDPVYVRLEDDEGNIAALAVTAQGLTTRITNAEGDISTLTQTANSLTSRITNAEGDISTLTQTANSLTSRITNAEGDISTLTQTVNSITLSVSNGTDSSTITLWKDGVAVTSKIITFSGVVTFTDLSTAGSTVINGANISTGTISAITISGCTITGGTLESVARYPVGNEPYGVRIASGSIDFLWNGTLYGSMTTGDGLGRLMLYTRNRVKLGLYSDGYLSLGARDGIVLGTESYGYSLPGSGEAGQLFFLL